MKALLRISVIYKPYRRKLILSWIPPALQAGRAVPNQNQIANPGVN